MKTVALNDRRIPVTLREVLAGLVAGNPGTFVWFARNRAFGFWEYETGTAGTRLEALALKSYGWEVLLVAVPSGCL